jgi:hypothetical protein
MEFDEIGFANQIEPITPHGQRAFNTHTRFDLITRRINKMMHSLPARCVYVVLERLFQMNQPTLARTVNPVLQGGESDNFISRIFHSIKQSLDEFIAREAMMRSYAGENSGKRAQPERVVIGNGDVMLTTNGASQP